MSPEMQLNYAKACVVIGYPVTFELLESIHKDYILPSFFYTLFSRLASSSTELHEVLASIDLAYIEQHLANNGSDVDGNASSSFIEVYCYGNTSLRGGIPVMMVDDNIVTMIYVDGAVRRYEIIGNIGRLTEEISKLEEKGVRFHDRRKASLAMEEL